MKTTTMFWHGGSSYAVFDTNDPDQAEHYPSLADALAAFDGRVNDPHYPCVYRIPPADGGPEAWLFFGDDGEDYSYPDRLLHYGPRGGLVIERA